MRSCLYRRPKHRRNRSFISIIGPLFLSIYPHTSVSAATHDQVDQSQSSSSREVYEPHPSSIARAQFSHSHASHQPHSQSRPSRKTQERETVIHYAAATKRRRHEAHSTSLHAAPSLTSSVGSAGNTDLSYEGYRDTHESCKAGPFRDLEVSVRGLSACDGNLNTESSSSWIDSSHASSHPETSIVIAQSQSQKRTYIDASKPFDLTIPQQRTPVPACMRSDPQALSSNSRQITTQQCSQHNDVETPSKANTEEPPTEQFCSVKLQQCHGPNGVRVLSVDLSCLAPETFGPPIVAKWPGGPLRIDKLPTDPQYIISLCEMIGRALQVNKEPSFGARADKTELLDACRRVQSFRTEEKEWPRVARHPALELRCVGRLAYVERIFKQLMVTFEKVIPYLKPNEQVFANTNNLSKPSLPVQAKEDCSSAALLCTLMRHEAPDFFTALISDPDLLWRLHVQLMHQEPHDELLESWKENQIYTIFACALIVAVQRALCSNFGWLKRARGVIRGEGDQLTLGVAEKYTLQHIIAAVKEILRNV